MKPINFREQNKVLTKPKGWTDKQCQPLAVYNDGKESISCWYGNLWDRLKFLVTGRMWMSVYSGETQPPVWVNSKSPFIAQWINETGKTIKCWGLPFNVWVVLEEHRKDCPCSYCRGIGLGIRLTLPGDKGCNSWRVLSFRTRMRSYYLRWTMPKFSFA